MSRETNVFDDIIEQKLLNLHTGVVAKIISLEGNTATVQPLSMIKQVGKDATKQAVVTGVPIGYNARLKLDFDIYNGEKKITAVPIAVGDTVFCLCAERDITETKKGTFATPQIGHHSIKDMVIICVLS